MLSESLLSSTNRLEAFRVHSNKQKDRVCGFSLLIMDHLQGQMVQLVGSGIRLLSSEAAAVPLSGAEASCAVRTLGAQASCSAAGIPSMELGQCGTRDREGSRLG